MFCRPPPHPHPHHGVGTEEDPPAGPSHLPLPAGVADRPRTLEIWGKVGPRGRSRAGPAEELQSIFLDERSSVQPSPAAVRKLQAAWHQNLGGRGSRIFSVPRADVPAAGSGALATTSALGSINFHSNSKFSHLPPVKSEAQRDEDINPLSHS